MALSELGQARQRCREKPFLAAGPVSTNER